MKSVVIILSIIVAGNCWATMDIFHNSSVHKQDIISIKNQLARNEGRFQYIDENSRRIEGVLMDNSVSRGYNILYKGGFNTDKLKFFEMNEDNVVFKDRNSDEYVMVDIYTQVITKNFNP